MSSSCSARSVTGCRERSSAAATSALDPQTAGAESLNVAMAGAIALYELARGNLA